jgi:hypothetical protein
MSNAYVNKESTGHKNQLLVQETGNYDNVMMRVGPSDPLPDHVYGNDPRQYLLCSTQIIQGYMYKDGELNKEPESRKG